MGSEVFYRKWRPQTLSEVLGQEPVTQTLRHAVESGKIAHAYLFCGPRGTGKTSMARILAKAVNCPESSRWRAVQCLRHVSAIAEGRALDVIEIDAASNRGIDEIRSLREKANYAPSLARYKVYIIDEVHMLTEAACNALLKTLEEPPGHVIFVLATTEAHKVIATIVSRCQRFNFRRLGQTEIMDKLKLICRRREFISSLIP
jgi:DNA polymerase III subunit gamma/tau